MQTILRTPEVDEPVYWFASMELAIDRGDLSAAAEAQIELERLGVSVKYRRNKVRSRPRTSTEGSGHE